jgi:hypothetical protein
MRSTTQFTVTIRNTLGYYEIVLTGASAKIIGTHNRKAGAQAVATFLSIAPLAVLAAYGVPPRENDTAA